MKKYAKELIILLIQILIFYVSPIFANPKSLMGMVFLILSATSFLSFVVGIVSKTKAKYLYPIIVAVVFVPSVFIYYNSSALIHSVWYFIVSGVGLLVGILVQLLLKKITEPK